MRILFAALHFGYFRNLESVVEELAARGHALHLVAERPDSAGGGQRIVERLAAQYSNVTFGAAPGREPDETTFVAGKVRLAHDYLRFLDPPYDRTPALRRRAKVRTPSGIVGLASLRLFGSRHPRRVLRHLLAALDRAVPPSAAIELFLDERQPDLVVITPLVGVVASSQIDLLRSAQRRRLPTAVCVWSWDHLSSKAIIRDLPDRLLVWNQTQKDEAVGMHGVPADRIVVTGAQCFDRWFDREPSRGSEVFCRRVGLPDDRPYVLWVCSALFPDSPSEAAYVVRWIAHLRSSSDERVRALRVLIRPHPSREAEWRHVEWQGDGVAMWGGNPIDDETRADYFDSLYYSTAVVGLNTSAFIEAGIVERPVLALLPQEFEANQEGTLHFRYLTTVGGGLLTTARSFDEHERQLGTILAGENAALLARQRSFVREFVRPHGLAEAATPILADALERLPQDRRGLTPQRRPSVLASLGLRALISLSGGRARRLLLDGREANAQTGYEDKRARAAEALAKKASARRAKARVVADRQRLERRRHAIRRRRQLTARLGALLGRAQGSE